MKIQDDAALELVFQSIVDKLKGEPPNCPWCHENQFSCSEAIYTVVEYQNSLEKPAERRVAPIFQIVCDHCSYTLFFNAVQMGIVKETN